MKGVVSVICGAVLFVSGCLFQHHKGPYELNYSGSDVGYASAWKAADVWNQTCGGIRITVSRGNSGTVDLVEVHGTIDGEHAGVTSSRFGEPYLVRFNGDMSEPGRYLVLVHEYGHVLGLEHTETGIMEPVLEPDDLIDAEGGLLPGTITDEQCEATRR